MWRFREPTPAELWAQRAKNVPIEVAMTCGALAYSVGVRSATEAWRVTERALAKRSVNQIPPLQSMVTASPEDGVTELTQNWGINSRVNEAGDNTPGALLHTTKGVFFLDTHACCIYSAERDAANPSVSLLAERPASWCNSIKSGAAVPTAQADNLHNLHYALFLALLHMVLLDIETLVQKRMAVHSTQKRLVTRLATTAVDIKPMLAPPSGSPPDTLIFNDFTACIDTLNGACGMRLQYMPWAEYSGIALDTRVQLVVLLGLQLEHQWQSVVIFVVQAREHHPRTPICRCPGVWRRAAELRYTIRPPKTP